MNRREAKRRVVTAKRIVRPVRRETILDFWGGGGETFGAGANGAEMIVGVDAGGVPVGERDLDGVVPYLGGGGGSGLWFEHGKDGRRSEGR